MLRSPNACSGLSCSYSLRSFTFLGLQPWTYFTELLTALGMGTHFVRLHTSPFGVGNLLVNRKVLKEETFFTYLFTSVFGPGGTYTVSRCARHALTRNTRSHTSAFGLVYFMSMAKFRTSNHPRLGYLPRPMALVFLIGFLLCSFVYLGLSLGELYRFALCVSYPT